MKERAIWLRREGDFAVVLIEKDDGDFVEAIREHIEGPFSHIIEQAGIESKLSGKPNAVDSPVN